MVDELNPPQEELEEADDTQVETEESEPDWKAEAERYKAQAEKAENDKKAALGSTKSQRERDELLWGLKDELDAMKRSNTALLKALSSGETDGLADELTKIQDEGAQSRASRQFDTRYASLYEKLSEAVVDEEGKSLLDFKSSDMVGWVSAWNDAYKRNDVVELTALYGDAVAKASRVVRERARDSKVDTDKARKAEAKKSRQKAADLDLGPASGAAKTSENLSPTERIARGLAKRGL